MGGPNSIPAMTYVVTIEIAIPDEYFGDIPARVNVMGIIDAVPKPTREKPINDVQKKGKVTASKIPSIIALALKI